MKRILVVLLMAALFVSNLFGQTPSKLLTTIGLEFPHGFHPFAGGNGVFFNAYHPAHGFQLYHLKDDHLTQCTDFKQEVTKKEDPEGLQGALTSNYVMFNSQLYFFATGKGITKGIYSYNWDKTKLVYACEAMSNGYLQAGLNWLATEVQVLESDTLRVEYLQIDKYLKVKRLPVDQNLLCSDLVQQVGGTSYAVRNGQLGVLEPSQTMVKFKALKYEKVELYHVHNLVSLPDGILFMCNNKEGDPIIGSVKNYDEFFTYCFPDRRLGEQFILKATQKKDEAYFVLHGKDTSTFYFAKVHEIPLEIDDVPNGSEINGYTNLMEQQIFSFANRTESDIYQINNKKLIRHEIKYITNPTSVTKLNGELLYQAKENGRLNLYTSEPLLPPKVSDQSFTIFDFYQNGRDIGHVEAKSLNERSRLRYYIVGGNPENVFRIDAYSGNIAVNNEQFLRSSGYNLYTLEIEVQEKRKGSSFAKVYLSVKGGKVFSHRNLRETLMFFPDFSRPNTLTTTRLPDGEAVYVYDTKFNMIDLLFVKDSTIVLPSYPAGMYIINVRNKENLYQKIELQ